MIEGPIKQDHEYVHVASGKTFTVLAGNEEGVLPTETILEFGPASVPAVVYYDQHDHLRTLICAESVFREEFREVE
jgi:hypothetical protein